MYVEVLLDHGESESPVFVRTMRRCPFRVAPDARVVVGRSLKRDIDPLLVIRIHN